jgi:recombination protein RecT
MTTATLKSNLQSKSVNNETSKSANNTIFGLMDKFKDQIAIALPRHMTADRMARIVTTEVRKTPELLKCNPVSLFGAVIQSSQLGLEPGNNLGHAYLLPFFVTAHSLKKDEKSEKRLDRFF